MEDKNNNPNDNKQKNEYSRKRTKSFNINDVIKKIIAVGLLVCKKAAQFPGVFWANLKEMSKTFIPEDETDNSGKSREELLEKFEEIFENEKDDEKRKSLYYELTKSKKIAQELLKRTNLNTLKKYYKHSPFYFRLSCAIFSVIVILLMTGIIKNVDISMRNRASDLDNKLKLGIVNPDKVEDNNLYTMYYLGTSNKLVVNCKTKADPGLKKIGTGAKGAAVSLVLKLKTGNEISLPLDNAGRDEFLPGSTDNFYITFPSDINVFDVESSRLVMQPDKNGKLDEWHCEWFSVSFLMNGEPAILCRDNAKEYFILGAGGKIESYDLSMPILQENIFLNTSTVYPSIKKAVEKGCRDFSNPDLISDTLKSLSIQSDRYLVVEVETASEEAGTKEVQRLSELGFVVPENDKVNYDGQVFLEIELLSKASSEGSKQPNQTYKILLDTKNNDFEFGVTDRFTVIMPEGYTPFDIQTVKLSVSNMADSWLPRFIRLRLPLGYGQEPEMARITDTFLIEKYGTAMFYTGCLTGSVEFDLTKSLKLPADTVNFIKSHYDVSLTGNAAKMYFETNSFSERQAAYYNALADVYDSSKYKLSK